MSEEKQALKLFVDLWLKENDIKTNKLMIFFLVQSILVGSIQFAGRYLYLTAGLGTVFSAVWYFCIGRTVAFQKHWKKRISAELPGDQKFFPSLEEEAQFPLYGKLSATLILLGPPFFAAIFWGIALVIILTKMSAK